MKMVLFGIAFLITTIVWGLAQAQQQTITPAPKLVYVPQPIFVEKATWPTETIIEEPTPKPNVIKTQPKPRPKAKRVRKQTNERLPKRNGENPDNNYNWGR